MAALAPSADTTRPADFAHSIADITSGNVDLTALTGKPNHAAQMLRLNNATTGALSAILTPEHGANFTVVVNAGQQYEVPAKVSAIVASGSGALSAVAYWWPGASLAINK